MRRLFTTFSNYEPLLNNEKRDCYYLCTHSLSGKLISNKLGENIRNNILDFTNFHKQIELSFVIYTDFETILKPIHFTEPRVDKSLHKALNLSIFRCSFHNSFIKLVFKKFVKTLEESSVLIINIYN